MVKIIVGNIFSKIVGMLPDSVNQDLDNVLSYKVQNARFMPNFKNGKWDGIVRLYQKFQGQSFYTGLMTLVRETLTKHKIQFELVDRRTRPSQNYPELQFNAPPHYENRDYQDLTIARSLKFTRGILEVSTGGGKCLGSGTKVLMFDGSTKTVESITVGDLLMGPDSTPRKVKSITKGYGDLYAVKQNNGDDFVCNDEHILCLQNTFNTGNRVKTIDREVEITAADYYKSNRDFKRLYKGYKVGVEFKHKDVPIDPYWLGLWLGDENSNFPAITTGDKEIVEYIYDFARHNKMFITEQDGDGCKTYQFVKSPRFMRIKKCSCGGMCRKHYRLHCLKGFAVDRKKNPLKDSLSEMGVLNNKHIPFCYKNNSREHRLMLLAGLIDSDGSFAKVGSVEFCNTNITLAEDVCWLARSLGFRSSLNSKKTSIRSIGYKGIAYSVRISGKISDIPIRIKRKQIGDKTKYSSLRYGICVSPIGKGDYFGFEIDGDRRFLLGDFTVTHNTIIVTKMISQIKTYPFLFYVLTKDLMEQAHDVLSTCLNVPIGIIGDSKVDIQKITVCTIQTAIMALNTKNPNFKIDDYCFDDDTSWDEKGIDGEATAEKIRTLIGGAKGIYFDECIGGDAMVLTENGATRMDEIVKNKCRFVQTYDGNNIVYKPIKKWWNKGIKDTINLVLNDGKKITCTKNHLFFTKRGWIRAENLVTSDHLFCADVAAAKKLPLPINTNWKTIKSIGKGLRIRVYDIEVEDTHCFFANGILVHNCHHASARTCKEVLLASPDAFWRFGGSATPKRESGDDIMLQALFGVKIVNISASYLIKSGYLVKPYIFFEPIECKTSFHTYSKIYNECVVNNDKFNRHVAETANHLISKKLSVLVLVRQISHGKTLENLIPNSHLLTGSVKSKTRTEVIEKLRQRTIPCMIATSLADEGLDIPSLDAVIIAGGGKSSTRLFQRIGRTLRKNKKDAKNKSLVILYKQDVRYLSDHTKRVRALLKREPEFIVADSKGDRFLFKEIDDVFGFENHLQTVFDI